MKSGTVIGFVLLITIIAMLPLAIIWSINTLFNLGIAYTFWTWLAVVVLTSAFGKTSVSIKRD
jgi:hypothetical protein